MNKILLILGFLLICHHFVVADWSEVTKHAGRLMTGISFTDVNNGWVSGFDLFGDGGAVILNTINGGQSWNKTKIDGFEAIQFRCIEMLDTTTGISSGVGIPTADGLAVTEDGVDWTQADAPRFLESSFLDCGILSSKFSWVVGQWIDALDIHGEGVLLSARGKFHQYNWNQTDVNARFGSFVSTSVGFVSGGNVFPYGPEPLKNGVMLNDYHFLDRKGRLHDVGGGKIYQGIVAVTKNGADSFQTVFDANQNGFDMYFNGISAPTQNNVWVVAVENGGNGTRGSYIWSSSNGGTTWTNQFYEDKVHLYGVSMIDTSNGWAWGYEAPDLTLFTGVLLQTTDGGKHWKKHNIRDTIIYRVSIIDANNAYAVGFGIDFSTNVYKWT